MNTLIFNDSSQSPPQHTEKIKRGGNKIVVGMVVKVNIGDLEAEIGEGFLIRIRK